MRKKEYPQVLVPGTYLVLVLNAGTYLVMVLNVKNPCFRGITYVVQTIQIQGMSGLQYVSVSNTNACSYIRSLLFS